MKRHAQNAADDGEIAEPLERPLPETHRKRNVRIAGQTAVEFGILGIVQDVNDVSTADAGITGIVAELLGAELSQFLHLVLGAEMQATGGARLDASGFEAFGYPVI